MPAKPIVINNRIGYQSQPGKGESFTVNSPYFGETIASVHESTAEDINVAVEAAQEGFRSWSSKPLKERCQVLFQFREVLLQSIDDIAQVVSLENGKTFAESKAGLLKGVEVLEFATSVQNLDQLGAMEVSRGVMCEYRREPLGVIANITPFNFPAMVPMWTIPIALVAGNSYLWKPSEKTPCTSMLLADALQKSGIPDGVFNVVQGGRKTVEAIIDHPQVKAIGFVGSSSVAKAVYQRGTALGKRVLALGGAKNHIVLLPDAHETISGKGISDSFTGCAGQRCMAASVLLAVGDTKSQIEAIKARAESQTLGDSMGAIITKEQRDFLLMLSIEQRRMGPKFY